MKTGLKWFLGIVIGLGIIVTLAGVGYMAVNHWQGSGWMMGNRNYQSGDNERAWSWSNTPGQGNRSYRMPQGNMPMRSFWGAPTSRIGFFRSLPMLVCCFFGLGFLVLLALGVVYLAGGLRRTKQPAVPPAAPVSLEAAPPAPEPVQSTELVCPHCAQPIQEGWKHCPHCGAPLTEQT